MRSLGLRRLDFQIAATERCVELASAGGRLLVEAPTGTGKTLIAHLTVAILAQVWRDRFRCIAVVPSRALVRQHMIDAAWLLDQSIVPVSLLTPSDGLRMWEAVIRGPGVSYTTPHALTRRLQVPRIRRSLEGMTLAVFDEIDVLMTQDSDERRDVWPALDACLQEDLPIVGFTGTALRPQDRAKWANKGFELWQPEIPEDWLPFTRVRFESISNPAVAAADRRIADALGETYRDYEEAGGKPQSWSQLKRDAQGEGALGALARRILGLHGERLRLFEGETDATGKLGATHAIVSRNTPALVLSRFVSSAVAVTGFLRSRGVSVVQADGRMAPSSAVRAAREFRDGRADVLVITRELGGRGLDFPRARAALLVSPRSSYRVVAQELARIRSRRGDPKEATVLYYEGTSETLKAARLAGHLEQDNRFGEWRLFEAIGPPKPAWELDAVTRAHLGVEEALEL